ncbi:alpha-N-acetylneuraminate alpha-2,8-sialyltransferase ST8SIA3-like [Saccoglossus kowalevskii]|uniref:Sia-alpha-2,3-Gal-beta-1,4-GlcNAc-R:alpha 2,8-sialyltransferase-like n=1 Tax=Saccoglossus kowalevskii TaxID=10224 RepID=A0ABM0LX56_SACKO|nr:PREDICTED: sia-alpha-2,3-Gal-beta-1,4-GlcNAc-R:alpha 2,8-sialyltransferase-like [Saccoglossus kowalevskii]
MSKIGLRACPRLSRTRILVILCIFPLVTFFLSAIVPFRTAGSFSRRRDSGILNTDDHRRLLANAIIHNSSAIVSASNITFALPSPARRNQLKGVIDDENIEEMEDDAEINMTEIEEKIRISMQRPWKFNSTLLTNERRQMQRYFDPHGVISLTKKDVNIGSTIHFHYSHARYIFAVPRTMYNILPEQKHFQSQQFDTCAVVGNGGIMLHSNCGDEIDKHDFIIRCNFPEVSGFEKDVGQRTDLLTFNPSILDKKYERLFTVTTRMKFQSDLQRFGRVILWVPAFAHHHSIPTFRILLDYLDEVWELNKNLQVAIPGEFLDGMFRYWETKGITERRLSTGLVMYSIATGICREVHLYGFYPFKTYHGTQLSYHYDENFREKDYVENKKYHKMPTEFAYFQQMHALGGLKLTIGECNNDN